MDVADGASRTQGQAGISSSKAEPKVFVVVLNCNGRQHLEYCLPSIGATAYGRMRVLVVDNGSRDDSLDVARRFDVEIVENGRNLGWAGGNNVGIRRAIEAGADYVILANNDIKVDPRWIAEAVRLAEAQPDVAVVGSTCTSRSRAAPIRMPASPRRAGLAVAGRHCIHLCRWDGDVRQGARVRGARVD